MPTLRTMTTPVTAPSETVVVPSSSSKTRQSSAAANVADAAAPPPLDPALVALRKDYRLASISQFVHLYKRHFGLEFKITDLEDDLTGVRPLSTVPSLLGKLLNTLANDRNVNASNWQAALRRQYNRRQGDRHAFAKIVKVKLLPPEKKAEKDEMKVDDVEPKKAEEEATDVEAAVAPESAAEGKKEELETVEPEPVAGPSTEEKPTAEPASAGEDPEPPKVEEVAAPEEEIEPLPTKEETPAPAPAPVASTSKPAPVLREDDASLPFEEVITDEATEETWYYDQRDVDWTEVDMETKVDAIYKICEWHMTEPDKFRRQLKVDVDFTWRLEPIGSDAKFNDYYFLDDGRMWIQRKPPRPPPTKIRLVVKPQAGLSSKKKGKTTGKASKGAVKAKSNAKENVGTGKAKGKAVAAVDGKVIKAPDAVSTKGKGKQKEEPLAAATTSRSRTKRGRSPSPQPQPPPATNSRTRHPRGSAAASTANASAGQAASEAKKRRTTRISRGSGEALWEEIPEELLKEWNQDGNNDANAGVNGKSKSGAKGGKGKGKEVALHDGDEEDALSDLTSLSDLSDVEDDSANNTNKKRASTEIVPDSEAEAEEQNDENEEEMDEDEKTGVDAEEEEEEQEIEAEEAEEELPPWEKEYWEERSRAEADGFIEWEAICVTKEEWESFPSKFEKSKDKNEKALRELVAIDILPGVLENLKAIEIERQKQIALMNRKRSSRLLIKESEAEEAERVAKEQAEAMARASRASRHKAPVTNADPEAVAVAKPAFVRESREERLMKREEERKAREEAAEKLAIEEAKKREREEAIKANGGVVPPGMETPEELAAMELAKKKEAKRIRDAESKRIRTAKRLAERFEYEKKMAEESWYLDCVGCQQSGWTLDDGSEIIQCDRCDSWVHLKCVQDADAAAGRPAVDYATANFVCAKCHADPTRTPASLPPRPAPPAAPKPKPVAKQVPSAAPSSSSAVPSATAAPAAVKPKRPRPSKLDENGQPIPKKPRVSKSTSSATSPAPAYRGNAPQASPYPQHGHSQHPQGYPASHPAYYNQAGPSQPYYSSQQPMTNGHPYPPNQASPYPPPAPGIAPRQPWPNAYPAHAQPGAGYGPGPAHYGSTAPHIAPQPVQRGPVPGPQYQSPPQSSQLQHPHQQPSTQAQPQQQSHGSSAPQANKTLNYEQLKAMVQADPGLMAQLPPAYQQHFSQLLNIPTVQPASRPVQTQATQQYQPAPVAPHAPPAQAIPSSSISAPAPAPVQAHVEAEVSAPTAVPVQALVDSQASQAPATGEAYEFQPVLAKEPTSTDVSQAVTSTGSDEKGQTSTTSAGN